MLKMLYSNYEKKIRSMNAAKIVYCLMAVDGDISKPEKGAFNKIAESFGVDTEWGLDDIKEKCEKVLDEEDDIYGAICDIVDEEIKNGKGRGDINQSLLLWNLMTIALSDKNYSQEEVALIEHIADELELDEAIFAELDNSIRALYSIIKEEKWLDESDVSEERKSRIKRELNKRKKDIKNSVNSYLEIEL